MPHVIGLRSPYALVGRLVYFGRMLDKIRLQARGELPADYQANYGDAKPGVYDARACRFLGLSHAGLVARVLQGGADEEILTWAQVNGTKHTEEEETVWSRFLAKSGWRDERSEPLRLRALELGLGATAPQTFFDLIEYDEGRNPLLERPWEPKPINTLIVMGVAGCGKSTLAQALAQALSWKFLEGDAFHSTANREKMSAGIPLTDADRAPWLLALRQALLQREHSQGIVLSCSALKETYRRVLAPDLAQTRFIHAEVSRQTLLARVAARTDHFMPAGLVDSQLATLEKPLYALTVDGTLPPAKLVAEVCSHFPLR